MNKLNASFLIAFVTLIYFFEACQKHLTAINNVVASSEIDTSLYSLTGLGGVDSGEIFLAFENSDAKSGTLAILNEKGDVVKEKKISSRVDDFQRWNIDGQTLYSYFEEAGTNPNPGVLEGYDVVCDTDFNVLQTAQYLPSQVDTSPDDRLDVHDFILLGSNHYMAIRSHVENPTNIPDSLHPSSQVKVIACSIQEVDNGQVVFQWDGTKFPELYSASVENNNFADAVDTLDYMHMNSICIDPNDNNIICSFRNLNEIIKIDRGSGNIIWRLGGINSDFPLTPDEVFLRQHYVRFTDDNKSLIFLDNGDIELRPYSRILEFKLNENARKIDTFSAYDIPDNFIQFAGSVKKTNDNYFIGGGSANYALQVNYLTNEVYLRLNQKSSSYRALKY